ncbi:nitrilase-related carbon-nitrogen hydrolase [Rhodococcus opacus]|uniref:nitrilase-related carbon-nitrogen hydrolase n=1 Tax=Rhodococcus opacus TaxID=37919 RepID=UPI00155A50D5|nr:nitrilase-related carbon-nitrogen hydrolase [Rhodococcus opacus]
MTEPLTIAPIQFELRAERTFDDLAKHVRRTVESAAGAGADIVLLPELVTTGLLASHPDADSLTVRDVADAYRSVFPSYTDEFEGLVQSLAVETSTTVVGGSHYRHAPDGTFRNTSYLAHPDGRIVHQDKLHLTPPEVAMGTTPGDEVAITEIGPVRVAVQICADIEFPEVSRYLAGQGVTLVLVPSLTWNRRGAHRVRYGAHARAMENQMYVAVSTLVGSCGYPRDGALHGTGNCFLAGPIDRTFGSNDGVLVGHEDNREEGAVLGSIDLDLLGRSRANPEPPGLRNIRPDLYQQLGAHTQ